MTVNVYTVPEVAAILRLHPSTVYRAINNGTIPKVDGFVESNRIPAVWVRGQLGEVAA